VSGRRRELSAEEKALWRRVARHVKLSRPLPAEPEDFAMLTRAARPTGAAVTRAPAADAPHANKSHVPVQDRGAEKRVRRGKLEIDASLDLHGQTYDQARASVARFLAGAHKRGARVVVIVTGKGRGGGGEGVLKRALPGWLCEAEVRGLVSGYAQAHRDHGGAGAFYVFVKRKD
jgi:DNA-nicking Smr family endonuclease